MLSTRRTERKSEAKISHYLLQQWNTQINISAEPETQVSGNDIINYYTQKSPTIQALHKATIKTSEVQTVRLLNWLNEKPL